MTVEALTDWKTSDRNEPSPSLKAQLLDTISKSPPPPEPDFFSADSK